ncbi:MAG: hypothetical protein D6800_10155 [Candidatus Zixiibacteriota bacterium]|nr:MAG: hypothetical protein D6800_10155 [candidate division Zixibacteria bacterium]
MNTYIIADHNKLIKQKINDILSAVNDLTAHGELNAAAIAIGDAWQLLDDQARQHVAYLVQHLANQNQPPLSARLQSCIYPVRLAAKYRTDPEDRKVMADLADELTEIATTLRGIGL